MLRGARDKYIVSIARAHHTLPLSSSVPALFGIASPASSLSFPTMLKNVLVFGATGKQGGAVVSALLALPHAKDFAVVAITRNPASPSAIKLASNQGVRVVKGDLDDPAALFASIGAPVWGVFSVQIPMGKGQSPVTEEKQGQALVDAALAHGHVKKFVYTSADRGGPGFKPTNVPHFASKNKVQFKL